MTAGRRVTVKLVKEYTRWNGDRYRAYATADHPGYTAVMIRRGRGGRAERVRTNAEAKETATWRLTAREGSIRFRHVYENDFTGMKFDVYERTDGAEVAVGQMTNGFLGGRKRTRRETRALAARKLGDPR